MVQGQLGLDRLSGCVCWARLPTCCCCPDVPSCMCGQTCCQIAMTQPRLMLLQALWLYLLDEALGALLSLVVCSSEQVLLVYEPCCEIPVQAFWLYLLGEGIGALLAGIVATGTFTAAASAPGDGSESPLCVANGC